MQKNYLSQSITQFCADNTSSIHYIFPTANNLAAGTYISEILDVKEVLNADETLNALDFYHELSDVNGDIIHVRFRYYLKELPTLAQELSKYPSITTWQSSVALQEEVEIAHKKTGSYMHIAARKACSVSKISSCSAVAPSPKRGGLSSRLSKSGNKPMQTSRQALISDVDDEDDSDDWEEYGDED